MADHLIDTNVFSRFFLGDVSVRQFLGGVDACISTVVYIELIQGSIKRQQRDLIKKHISAYPCYQITPQISLKAIELIDKYSASHGLFLADALIAATALEHELTLITFNTKDFKFMKGVKVTTP
jgi:predicted nucleic acid-binding protein